MINTKHDLSAGIAKLNFAELKEAVGIGLSHSLWACERNLYSVQTAKDLRARMNAAIDLANSAESLRKTSVSFFYMFEAETREQLEIVR